MRRRLSCEHLIYRRTESIDVKRNGERAVLMIVGLLYRRISRRTHSYRRARFRLAGCSVLLCKSKIYEDCLAVIFYHHILGLDVQMQHPVTVHIRQGIPHIIHYAESLRLIQPSLLLDIIVKIHTLDILHDIIRRVVLIKHVEHFHDVWMIQLRQILCLTSELLAVVGKDASARALHAASVCRTCVDVAHEEFLNSDLHLSFHLSERPFHYELCRSEISHAERAMAERTQYPVFSALQRRHVRKYIHTLSIKYKVSLYSHILMLFHSGIKNQH